MFGRRVIPIAQLGWTLSVVANGKSWLRRLALLAAYKGTYAPPTANPSRRRRDCRPNEPPVRVPRESRSREHSCPSHYPRSESDGSPHQIFVRLRWKYALD